ncbi:hypothetical protein JKF63_01349 [Porcisia hertigi]|uniref:Uncharacterized protein n=1 Tax=Porcisia hertigi TaxID=2761500 RepID=A0A836KZJ6_9TRYP|nr:hypothetical protein JKF63_01349 [Porcisia hertigi]
MQSYLLEVAVKRVYGLNPLIASLASKIVVEVRFLDFPFITVHPQKYAVGDTVTYNVCHKADFRMKSEQAVATFPVTCQCQLVTVDSGAVPGTARWSCPCPLVPQSDAAAEPSLRTYANYVIRNAAGETVGYADMNCRVLSQDVLSTAPVQAPAPVPVYVPTRQASVRPPPIAAPPTSAPEPSRETQAEPGKPYILRVIVSENDRHRRPSQPARCDNLQGASRAPEATAATHASSNGRGQQQRPLSANTAERGTLLHLLQYDVAYQLQSLSETVAAALQREHDVLTRIPLKGSDRSGSVRTAKLTKSIDQHVASIVRLANIILQVANQLVDNSPAPPHTGTSRKLKDMAQQKRNPVNKLPLPANGSVGHYLMYDVLYQLQCLGTNLSYMTVAYRVALDTSLSSIPAQHVEYCDALAHDIQHLTKRVNILIQSSIDGTLSTATLPVAPGPVALKKGHQSKKTSAQDSPQVAVSQVNVPQTAGVARSLSSSSHSSFSSLHSTSSSSFTSSSLSSSSSSFLNLPTTAAAPQPPPAAAPAPTAVTPMRQTSPSSSATPPLASPPPPPNTVAVLPAQPTAKPLATPSTSHTQLSVSLPINTPTTVPHANQLAIPVSQIQQLNSLQPPPIGKPSSVPAFSASQNTGLYGAVTSSSYVQQPVLATGSAPMLNPPYLSSVPPPLASLTPLTPPSGTLSPPVIPAPNLTTPPSTQPQPQVTFPISIPVPIPH